MNVREGLVSQVVAAVLSADRTDGIGPQVGTPGGLGDGPANLPSQLARTPAGGMTDKEEGRARVLTDRRRLGSRQVDVFPDRVQRAAGGRSLILVRARPTQRPPYIRGEI